MSADGFLSRWARRKADVASGRGVESEPPVPTEAPAAATSPPRPQPVDAPLQAGLPRVRAGAALADSPVSTDTPPETQADTRSDARSTTRPEPAPALTMDDVQALTRDSSFAQFVNPGVDAGVRNAAMKKLFTDPHYNVMDGLDTYIEDYGIPDPIPMAMLRQMNQSKFLGLFAKEEAEEAAQAEQARLAAQAGPDAAIPQVAEPPLPPALPTAEPSETPDEDPDLRLQQDDGAGRPGAGPGPDDPTAA